jgi:hypothetical protein
MMPYGWGKFGCEQERYHEIIGEAVGLLGSLRGENWNEERCRTDVCYDVNIIFQAHKEPRQDLRKIRDRSRAAITQLERAERAIEKIAEIPVYKSLLENHIRPALNAVRFYADRVTFSSGGPRRRKGEPLNTIAKSQAAACAFALIRDRTGKKPSADKNYLQLTRLLFEAATGIGPDEEGQSIERQCRDYASWAKSQA